MITVTGPDDRKLYRFLKWAILRNKPVTITYLKQSKGEDGNFLWERQGEAYVPVLEPTVRTVEPWFIEKEGSSDAYVRGMDRDSKEPRSWRLDRIEKITYHRRGRQIIPAYVTVESRTTTKRA